MTLVDSHLHVWDLGVSDYDWLTPAHGDLRASWSIEQAEAELGAAEVDGAILVQAEDSTVDTRFLLETAERSGRVVGVVGWIPLDDPDAAARALEEAPPSLRGIRHLLADDPRAEFLDLPTVRRSLATLAQRHLAFDVHDAWPRHLDQAAKLAASVPDLLIVLDHLGKPPIGRGDYGAWQDSITRFAQYPNTVAKVSGLATPGTPFTADALRETWETALDRFGSSRLMYGGDWPMTAPHVGYGGTLSVLAELIGELSRDEQADLWSGTAMRTYRIDARPPDRPDL